MLLLLVAIALAGNTTTEQCACEKLGFTLHVDCTSMNTKYNLCEWWNAILYCDPGECANVVAYQTSCTFTCECASGCSASMLRNNVCDSACNNAACDHDNKACVVTTNPWAACDASDTSKMQSCLDSASALLDICEKVTSSVKCYQPYSCATSLLSEACNVFEHGFPNCSVSQVCDSSNAQSIPMAPGLLSFVVFLCVVCAFAVINKQ
jgi:hypothetical protein